ncbi:MAG: hypothetical protein ACR2HR_10430 [Euzebya sp.]
MADKDHDREPTPEEDSQEAQTAEIDPPTTADHQDEAQGTAEDEADDSEGLVSAEELERAAESRRRAEEAVRLNPGTALR